jgi:hypothetical protein
VTHLRDWVTGLGVLAVYVTAGFGGAAWFRRWYEGMER